MAGWLIPAAYAAQTLGSAASSYGDMESAKAMRNAMAPSLDQNAALAQGSFDYATGQFVPYQNAGNRAMGQFEQWQEPTPTEFQYNNTAQQFLDPSIAYQQDQARRQAEAVGGPVGLSGGALRSLNARATDIAGTGYNNAVNQMQTDKNFAYQQFLNDFAARKQNAMDQYNKLSALMNIGQNATNNLVSSKQLLTGQLAGINEQRGQLQGAVSAARAGAFPKFIAGALGGAGQAATSYVGAQQNQQWMDSWNQPTQQVQQQVQYPQRSDYGGYGAGGEILNPTEQAIMRGQLPQSQSVQQGNIQSQPIPMQQQQPSYNPAQQDYNTPRYLNMFPQSRYG